MARFHTRVDGNVSFTLEEETQRDAEEAAWADGQVDRYLEALREERNHLLAESDYTQLEDAPGTSVKKAAWAVYRQELRDLPVNTADPEKPIWPKEPGSR